MSIFKVKKLNKIICFSFLIIFLFSFFLPAGVIMAEVEPWVLNLELVKETIGNNKKINWEINANTTGICQNIATIYYNVFIKGPGNEEVHTRLVNGVNFPQNDLDPSGKCPYTYNYNTGYILSPDTFYTILFSVYKTGSFFADDELIKEKIFSKKTMGLPPTLKLTTTKSTVEVNEATKIKVSTVPVSSEVIVNFTSTPSEEVFTVDNNSQTWCMTGPTGYCEITFTAGANGNYLIFVQDKDKKYFEKFIGIEVKGNDNTPPPTTEMNYYPLADIGIGETCEDDGTGKTVCVKLAPQVCEKDASGKEICRDCLPTDTAESCKPGLGFAGYLNALIKIFIALCAVLAMIMIIAGGIQYMTSELVSGKAAGKEQILHAILGLLLALGAYAILNTINPQLLDISLSKLETATVTISPEDTSTGSSTTLCLSTTSPPNPNGAKGVSMKSIMAKPAMPEYETEISKIISASTGKKYLATAQTGVEGFYPGSKSYTTHNPGNIGNTDDGKTRSFDTLAQGIDAQINKVISGQGSYQIGSKPTCALGNEAYDGSLYQYLRIYATGARQNNNYVNYIIGFFADKGITITARTKMSEIYNMGGSYSGGSGTTTTEKAVEVIYRPSKSDLAIIIDGPLAFRTPHRINIWNTDFTKKLFSSPLTYEALTADKSRAIWKSDSLDKQLKTLEDAGMLNITIYAGASGNEGIGTLSIDIY